MGREMAFSHSISRLLNPFMPHLSESPTRGGRRCALSTRSTSKRHAAASTTTATSKDDIPQQFKKSLQKAARAPRRLISLSTSDGRYHGQWSCDYVFSLRELQLADLAEDGQKDADVFISLSVQKALGSP